MGQAKQRGTLEQRKAIAIERNKAVAKILAAYEATRPKPKTSITTTAIMGIVGGAFMSRGFK